MKKRHSQEDHDKLVDFVATALFGKEFSEVRVDLAGYARPERIVSKKARRGHVPDATAWKGRLVLFEVETPDSIDSARNRWLCSADYAKKQNAQFFIVVPAGFGIAVRQRLDKLGVEAGVWEV